VSAVAIKSEVSKFIWGVNNF